MDEYIGRHRHSGIQAGNISSQFDLRTGFKDKPGSQGTLFRVSPSARTPASRQPRGYSRQRYEEVGYLTGLFSQNMVRTQHGRDTWGHQGVIGAPEHRQANADALATIARSTVPLWHLASPQSPGDRGVPVHPNASAEAGTWRGLYHQTALGPTISVKGNAPRPKGRVRRAILRMSDVVYPQTRDPVQHYTPSGREMPPAGEDRQNLGSGRARRRFKRDPLEATRGFTPIHEVGHHAEAMGYARKPVPGGGPVSRGIREGFADKYAAEHARRPGYKRQRVDVATYPARPYDWHESYGYGDATPEERQVGYRFNEAYNHQRYGTEHHPSVEATKLSEQFDQTHPAMLRRFAHGAGDMPGEPGRMKIGYHWDYDPEISGVTERQFGAHGREGWSETMPNPWWEGK